MTVKVLFFGALADAAVAVFKTQQLDIELSEKINSVDSLKDHLIKIADQALFTEEINKPSNLCSVNQSMTDFSTVLVAGDEVAFMSPLSGG